MRFPPSKSLTGNRANIAIAGVLGLFCNPVVKVIAPLHCLVVLLAFVGVFSSSALAQQNDSGKPVVVQPGAPGKASKTLPSSTKATLPPLSQADVEFMQGMIMHHAQAIEMTALIDSHTENKGLYGLGARISRSQSDEIKFMQRWLAVRGEPVSMPPPKVSGHQMDMDHHANMSHDSRRLMPGMSIECIALIEWLDISIPGMLCIAISVDSPLTMSQRFIKSISSDCDLLMRAPSVRNSLFWVCDSMRAVISTAWA